MTAEEIIKGLQIIEKARPSNVSPYHIRAEHDQIFAGSSSYPISEEDKLELIKLGWEPDSDVDGYHAMV